MNEHDDDRDQEKRWPLRRRGWIIVGLSLALWGLIAWALTRLF